MNAPSCYCCNLISKIESPLDRTMELDAALNELGLLSTITNSRLDYLQSKDKKRNRSSKSLCVVQMNSDFVTEFSVSKTPIKNVESESDEENGCSTPVECEKGNFPLPDKLDFAPYCYNSTAKKLRMRLDLLSKSNGKIRRRRYRHYMYKPYDFPWRSKLEDSLKNIPAATAASERASPPTVSRQDSGNKSNPSSPVKSQKSLTNLGCSIFRSRSLDDLEISKLDLKEGCCFEANTVDIDTVSQRISKLHVS